MDSAIRLMVAAACMLCVIGASRAAAQREGFEVEMSRQDAIMHGRLAEHVEGYTIDRSLSHYESGLCSGFRRSVAQLEDADRWLDIGAGEGNALLDYLTSSGGTLDLAALAQGKGKATVVAMSVEDRRTHRWRDVASRVGRDKLRYLAGKRLRGYSAKELGRFRLVTDVVGGFSYSLDLSLFMEQVLGVLEKGGSFYTLLADVRTEGGRHAPHYFADRYVTEIRRDDGSELTVCAWLRSIACVEVQCELKEWEPVVEAYRVRKTCDAVSVPKLAPVGFVAGTPPGRSYVLAR